VTRKQARSTSLETGCLQPALVVDRAEAEADGLHVLACTSSSLGNTGNINLQKNDTNLIVAGRR
jgi:hypothetical protein